MCLITDKASVECTHMTCNRFLINPSLYENTKKEIFNRRKDFHVVKLSRNAENEPNTLKISNPHKSHTNDWNAFEPVRMMVNELKAVGRWPKDSKYTKADIDIQFFLYARRIQQYNGLTKEYESSGIVLDVAEAAVYCGTKEVY
jgi:hypothetical protein